MYRNSNHLQFRIHHKHPHNRYLQLVHPAIQMLSVGIYIHRFVSLFPKTTFHLTFSSKSYIYLSYIRTAPPSYAESEYRAKIVDKNDSQHTRITGGQSEFAPRYPVYVAQPLPALPNTPN